MSSKSLFNAIGNSDIKLIVRLLKKGADPNIKDGNGDPVLYRVLFTLNKYHNTSVKMTKALLQYGANPNVRDINGKTPLHIAVALGNTGATKTLLQYGADPNIKDDQGNTPLFSAVEKGNPKIIEALLYYGADMNVKNDEGDTVLHLTSAAKNIELTKTLLQHGAIPILNNWGYSPLDYTDCMQSYEICDLLLQYGAKSNKESNFLYLVGASPNYHDEDTLVFDLMYLLDKGFLNLNPPDPDLQELIAEKLTSELYAISDSSDLSMTVSSLVLRTLSVFSPFLIG